MEADTALANVLKYDAATGKLFWAIGKKRLGKEAGCIQKIGYIALRYKGKFFYAHRVAWFLVHGVWPDYIDHINGNRTDNRLENLRNVSKAENHRNMRRFSTNTSRVTGVNKHTQCNSWVASMTINNKRLHLGSFSNFEDAVAARKAAEVMYNFHPNHGRG